MVVKGFAILTHVDAVAIAYRPVMKTFAGVAAIVSPSVFAAMRHRQAQSIAQYKEFDERYESSALVSAILRTPATTRPILQRTFESSLNLGSAK